MLPKWTERQFNFDLSTGLLPNVITRLEGTAVRMHSLVATLTDEELSYKPAGKWSIKEQLGHLSDLEDLHIGRIDDFIARKPHLRPADMSNASTEEADYNRKNIEDIIAAFSLKRIQFISSLESLDRNTQEFASFHTRLNCNMRPIDLASFTAEHDDHHLTYVRKIKLGLRR